MNKQMRETLSFIIVIILIGTIVLPIQNEPARAQADPQYWALVVGIGDYADNPEEDRPDMILEANDFRDLLLQSPWWSADHIRVLTGEYGTVSDILAGFRWLIKMASADDVVVVYLSTHGMYLNFDIPPRDEADSLDEFLVSYWGFAYNTSFITDDTINLMLNKLESNNVCLIVDSCYAGGMNDHWKLLKSAPEQNRVILMGSCEDELSYSGGFAPYLIDGFRGYADANQDGLVTAEEAFNYSRPRSIPRQTPTIYDGYPGELVITTNTLHQMHGASYHKKGTPAPRLHPAVVSAETTVLCGYVNGSGQPLENATVTVSGRINYQQYYTNTTMTDQTGYYFMHVPAMRIRVTVSAYGFCDKTSNQFNVYANNTYWYNVTLVPHPAETAVVRGYIFSAVNSSPLAANITLHWQDALQNTYRNTTTSATDGHYQMNVAPGEIRLDILKEGYFTETSSEFNLTDGQTLWMNISLFPFPLETATICGYISDESTGAPIHDVRIDFIWVNITIGHQYDTEAQTNESGFYSTPIAPGELYVEIREEGYDYYDPYRHDAQENTTTWMNVSLTPQTIDVEIAKPLRALYFNNNRVIPYSKPRIIGPIDIQAYIPGEWGQPSQAQMVEFYIDGTLQATITAEPFNWTWSQKTIGKHTIKVVAYGLQGDVASKELEVYKFL